MRKPLAPPPILVEQERLRSGPIVKSGFNKYGIIFSTHDNASENDFDPASLDRATLVNPAIPGVDGHFTILGGYFAKRAVNNSINITKAFGDVLDASLGFGIKNEKGATIIGDTWLMEDISNPTSSKNFLDERTKGKDGWTFLVTYKPSRPEYPFSGKQMEIYTTCPEISIDNVGFSLVEANQEFIDVEVSLAVADGPVPKFEWNFGDGSTPVITDVPKATHKYSRAFEETTEYTLTVKAQGPGDCLSETTTAIPVSGRDHPALKEVTGKDGTYSDQDYKIIFEASLIDPKNPHTSYDWDFGDNSPAVTQPALAPVTHVYKRGDAHLSHTVTVNGSGPGTCKSKVSTSIRIDPARPPCPVIGEVIEVDKKNIDSGKTQYKLRAEYTGVNPTKFVWTWTDADREFVRETKTAEVDVVLDRTEQNDRPVIIKVNTFGPFDCRGNSEICVHVPAVPKAVECPWYMKAFPYFLALVTTLVVSAVIVCWAGENLGQTEGEAGKDWMYTWTIIMAFLFIIGGFVWAAIGKKGGCGPRICSILMILATALIGSSIFTLFIGDCYENHIVLFAMLLILGILCIIYYMRTCKDKTATSNIVIFIGMGIIGIILAIVVHAQPSLLCV